MELDDGVLAGLKADLCPKILAKPTNHILPPMCYPYFIHLSTPFLLVFCLLSARLRLLLSFSHPCSPPRADACAAPGPTRISSGTGPSQRQRLSSAFFGRSQAAAAVPASCALATAAIASISGPTYCSPR